MHQSIRELIKKYNSVTKNNDERLTRTKITFFSVCCNKFIKKKASKLYSVLITIVDHNFPLIPISIIVSIGALLDPHSNKKENTGNKNSNKKVYNFVLFNTLFIVSVSSSRSSRLCRGNTCQFCCCLNYY